MEKILQNSGESTAYLHDGFPYEPGDTYRKLDLAKTFKRLVSHGWRDFYEGAIAREIIEFGMSLDETTEAPRFFTYSSEGAAKSLFVESRIPPHILRSLEKIGHFIEVREAYDKYFGGAQGILIDRKKNRSIGRADPRRDGSGAGY